MDRRQFLGTLPLLTLAAPGMAETTGGSDDSELRLDSPLIYISPLKSDGSLSRCQAEVWFAEVDGALYVVTQSDAWRARAVSRGLTAARIWVGDQGVWRRGRYTDLPSARAEAAFEQTAETQARVLDALGDKYSAEWGRWGPRFRKGLTQRSRVMLRYRFV